MFWENALPRWPYVECRFGRKARHIVRSFGRFAKISQRASETARAEAMGKKEATPLRVQRRIRLCRKRKKSTFSLAAGSVSWALRTGKWARHASGRRDERELSTAHDGGGESRADQSSLTWDFGFSGWGKRRKKALCGGLLHKVVNFHREKEERRKMRNYNNKRRELKVEVVALHFAWRLGNNLFTICSHTKRAFFRLAFDRTKRKGEEEGEQCLMNFRCDSNLMLRSLIKIRNKLGAIQIVPKHTVCISSKTHRVFVRGGEKQNGRQSSFGR